MISLLLALLLTQAPDGGQPQTLPELRRLAKQLEPEVAAPWVKRWLANVNALRPVTKAAWFCAKDKTVCAEKNPGDFLERVVDDEFAYARITDPLGYARAFEVLAAAGFDPTGKKVLDFGYGNFGQLLMLSALGVDVHGVEIDALLPLAARGLDAGKGRLTLHHGFFARDPALVKALGGGYALWMSKNTLKRGYVHPAEPEGAKGKIDLGLEDAELLALIHRQLAPGGLFFIYNLAPTQARPYEPMADGRCPFTKQALHAAGFEVLAFDADDSAKAKQLARALEWQTDWPDVDASLVATWTLARRPLKR